MNKVTSDIKNILLSKFDDEEAASILEQIMEKIGSIKLVKTTSPKRKKDKDAPKNPQNAYMFFCNSNRVTFKKENPDMNATTIVKHMAHQWHALSEEEKKPYREMAEKDKLRYTKAIDTYKKEISSSSDEENKEVKTKSSRTADDKKGKSGDDPKKKAPVKKTKTEEKKSSVKKTKTEEKTTTKKSNKTISKIPKNPPVAMVEDDDEFDDEEPTEE